VRVKLGKPVTAQCGKFSPMCLLFSDDAVQISIWRLGGMHSGEYCLIHSVKYETAAMSESAYGVTKLYSVFLSH